MRLYGNINKTEPDAWDINHAQNGSYAAGREGVRNKDINALLSWKNDPATNSRFQLRLYSRQGNIYAGDTQYSNGNLSPNGLVDFPVRPRNKSPLSPVLGTHLQRSMGLGSVQSRCLLRENQQYPACRKALPAASKA